MDKKVEGEGQTTTTENGEGQTTETTQAESGNDLEVQLKAKDQTIQRLLKESKTYKEKYKALESKLEENVLTETEKPVEQKDKKESHKTVELLMNKLKEKDAVIAKKDKININKTIDVELAKYASDAHKLDAVKKFLPADIINVSESDDDIIIDGVKEAVDMVKKEHPYLFKTAQATKTVSSKPGVVKKDPLDLAKLSQRELAMMLTHKRQN